jgi:hypothetical protein
MYRLAELISMIDHSLNTTQKRQIAGGILMSISLLFGGLAITIMTIRTEDNTIEQYLE